MILCYAGLKTVPDDLYEAARVDGATAWQTLLQVTIPTMLPILLTNLALVVVQTFNTFDMILSLTGGGPGTSTQVLALSIYDQIFRLLNLGRGAAIAVVLMVINFVMIVLAVAFIFPLLWVLSLSLKTGPETLQSPPSLIPEQAQWANYGQVLQDTPIGRYLLNSLFIVFACVLGALALSTTTSA